MRRPPKTAALVACLSLLGLQLTGLHLHANNEGFDPVPHGTHVHGVPHRHDLPAAHADTAAGEDVAGEHHDHDGDRDVAAVELGSGVAKLAAFLPTDTLSFLVSPPGSVAGRAEPTTRPMALGLRWRPPLRGPPRLSV